MKEMWDKRYSESKYVYGVEPNVFFKKELKKLKPGRLLIPGEGEGRNAAFAVQNNWEVTAFDYSAQAVENAKQFVSNQGINLNYFQADILNLPVSEKPYDALAFLYLHLSKNDRKIAHRFISESVKPGGVLILEVFSKKQLGRNSGGPKNIDMLYDLDEIHQDFSDFEFLYLKEEEVELMEGDLHQGKAMTIRFLGCKK